MANARDPWLAVNLSWTMAGLGQFYAGRKTFGAVLLALEILLWAAWVSWAIVPSVSLGVLLGVQLALLLLWITSAWTAYRMVRPEVPPDETTRTPWKSVFFTRFIPGSGHMLSGQWVRGILYAALTLALMIWPSRESLEPWQNAAFYGARALVLLDSYLILRRQNPAARSWTWIAMGAILLGSQTWILLGALRTYVVEAYKIPSSAMEPTLMGAVGDNHTRGSCPFAAYHEVSFGDRILVSKPAYRFSPVRRFDVAVFKFPLNQSKNFVKRVVGLPDEELMIHAGDLYVRPKDASRFEIARKPLDVQDRIWIRIHAEADAAADPATFGRYWGADATTDAQGGVKLPASPNGVKFQDPVHDAMGFPVRDVRLCFEVRRDPAADVVARLVNPLGTLELEFPRGQAGRLRLVGAKKEPKELPLQPGALLEGRWHAVELMFYDGQAVVRLDSKVLGHHPLVDVVEDVKATDESPTAVSFCAAKDGMSLRNVRVERDIHYRGKDNREFGLREDEPLKIPADQYVCFGDNVANSHDSRAWVKRTFVLKDGRKIVCESQQVNEGYSRFNRQLQEKLGLPEPPMYGIDGDEHGDEVFITREQFLREEEPQPVRFVDRRFFVGRVVKIWWPLVRAGPVR